MLDENDPSLTQDVTWQRSPSKLAQSIPNNVDSQASGMVLLKRSRSESSIPTRPTLGRFAGSRSLPLPRMPAPKYSKLWTALKSSLPSTTATVREPQGPAEKENRPPEKKRAFQASRIMQQLSREYQAPQPTQTPVLEQDPLHQNRETQTDEHVDAEKCVDSDLLSEMPDLEIGAEVQEATAGETVCDIERNTTEGDVQPRPPRTLAELMGHYRTPLDLSMDSQMSSIALQVMEMEETMEARPNVGGPPCLAIRIYGRTAQGQSVVVAVWGFCPHFLVEKPTGWDRTQCSAFVAYLKRKFASFSSRPGQLPHRVIRYEIVRRQSIMGYSDELKDFLAIYVSSSAAMWSAGRILGDKGGLPPDTVPRQSAPTRLSLFELNVDPVLRYCIEANIKMGSWMEIKRGTYSSRGFAQLGSTCQLELDTTFDSTKACTTPAPPTRGPSVAVQAEAKEETEDDALIAPLRIAAFDIECVSASGRFPVPSEPGDRIVMIATALAMYGDPAFSLSFVHLVCIGDCNSFVLPAVQGREAVECVVECVESETALLACWARFITEADPDLIVGYNNMGFDLPYILARASLLGLDNYLAALGRLRATMCPRQQTNPTGLKGPPTGAIGGSKSGMGPGGKASGTAGKTSETVKKSNLTGTVDISGRVQLDLYRYIQREHNLDNYSLNAVSRHFLNDEKEEVAASSIGTLFRESVHSRTRLAKYCCKDAWLCILLMDRLQCVVNVIAMARVTGVSPQHLLSRGQQRKVFAMILRHIRGSPFVVPAPLTTTGGRDIVESSDESEAEGEDEDGLAVHGRPQSSGKGRPAELGSLRGGAVIDASKGFYSQPIATLDFASLYPSIIIAHNLSFETMVIERSPALNSDEIHSTLVDEHTATSTRFLKDGLRGRARGVLPTILMSLLQARVNAKTAMKRCTDPVAKAILNGRQLALKISCNSMYGFCGVAKGVLPCMPIAHTVTAIGRGLILRTKRFIEQEFVEILAQSSTTPTVTPVSCRVVYGDTDSVMIDFGIPAPIRHSGEAAAPDFDQSQAVRTAMELGRKVAEFATRLFPSPIQLQFEKVYCPYLLLSKKRYAGLPYSSSPTTHDGLDAKGLVTVRRDACLLLRETFSACLDFILQGEVALAEQHVKRTVALLRNRQIPMHKLILSKKLTKTEYKTKTVHAGLVQRLQVRDPANSPKVGDRIAYVIVEHRAEQTPGFASSSNTKTSSLSEFAEDPLYVLDHSIPINTNWYINNQLRKPLMALFEPLIPSPTTMFSMERNASTSAVFAPQSTVMRAFLNPYTSPRCLACKCVLSTPPSPPVAKKGLKELNINSTTQEAPMKLAPIFLPVKKNDQQKPTKNAKGAPIPKQSSKEEERKRRERKKHQAPLCTDCVYVKESLVRMKQILLEDQRGRLTACWETCTKCAGSREVASLCRNVTCKTLYERRQAVLDIEECAQLLERIRNT